MRRALADRLRKDVPEGDRERVRHAFRLCLGREPTAEELRKVERYLTDQRAAAPPEWPAGRQSTAGNGRAGISERSPIGAVVEWVGFARALLNLDEFITRE